MTEVKENEIYYQGVKIPLSPAARARRSLEEWQWSPKWRVLIYADPQVFEIIEVNTGQLWSGADFLLQKRGVYDSYWQYPRKKLPFEVQRVGDSLQIGGHPLDLDLGRQSVASYFFEDGRFIVLARDRADLKQHDQIIAYEPNGKRLWSYSNNVYLIYWHESRRTVIADISATELIEIDPKNGQVLGPAKI